jgi:hypothetical protein
MSIGPTERLCWKPSIYGNSCQLRDQIKDALLSKESIYRPATERPMDPPVGQSEGKRGATLHRCGSLLDPLWEPKENFGW